MPNHLGIILAAATTLISAGPAFAFGSSHSSSSTASRAGTAARSVGVTSTRLSPSTRFQSQAPPQRQGPTHDALVPPKRDDQHLAMITSRRADDGGPWSPRISPLRHGRDRYASYDETDSGPAHRTYLFSQQISRRDGDKRIIKRPQRND